MLQELELYSESIIIDVLKEYRGASINFSV